MALAHTILASLANTSYSGYDLNKRFQESISCYWKASQQQIYRELGKLEKQGWVVATPIPQEGKPDKKLYCITDLGKQELLDWLAAPSNPTPIREDLLVKVLAGYLMPREVLVQELKRRRQLHEERLLSMGLKEKEHFFPLADLPIEEKFRYLTLKRGLRYEADWIAWCDEVLELLETEI